AAFLSDAFSLRAVRIANADQFDSGLAELCVKTRVFLAERTRANHRYFQHISHCRTLRDEPGRPKAQSAGWSGSGAGWLTLILPIANCTRSRASARAVTQT